MLNAVVICLKNRTFAVSQTTLIHATHLPHGLWFAWKIVLLQYRKQPLICGTFFIKRCDLLEKSYFCSIANNRPVLLNDCSSVVICLKNRTFAVSQTTFSIFFICWVMVVICLKNRTFAVSQTTSFGSKLPTMPLWFAWKIVLLQYRKQRLNLGQEETSVVICLKNRTFAVSQTTLVKVMFLSMRCDLLEKSYFCSIANNRQHGFLFERLLWFAWKIVLLQYRKQLKHHIYLYHKQIQRFKK